jgi:hypothetical protein
LLGGPTEQAPWSRNDPKQIAAGKWHTAADEHPGPPLGSVEQHVSLPDNGSKAMTWFNIIFSG